MKQKATLNLFIKQFLQHRPAFFSFLRPQEALLLYNNLSSMKHPILDYGCGDGFFASLIFPENFIDVALDISDSRIQEAKKYNIYKSFQEYDGKQIPFPDNHFSTIFSNSVLEHVPYLDLALQEIYRVLKPGGIFMTTVMADKWEDYLNGQKLLGPIYLKWLRKKQEHYNLLSYKEWKKHFTDISFKEVSSQGYFSKKMAQWDELFHYLSLPSLISYSLIKRWINIPPYHLIPPFIVFIEKTISNWPTKEESASLFFVLQKK